MTLKELPIYWDLLRLPLPVLFRRLRRRLRPERTINAIPKAPAGLTLRPQLDDLQSLKLDLGKWDRLWEHYRQDEFNYLGSGWTSLRNGAKPAGFAGYQYYSGPRPDLAPGEIDWNRDQRTGFQFSLMDTPGSCLQQAFQTEGVDVKFSWEFARMLHLPQLGLYAGLRPERKSEIAVLFQRHFQSFSQQCPYGMGIHWTSPMEVAIRLCNLLIGYDLLRKELPALATPIVETAYQHWYFVKHHLEDKDGYGTNHYLSNLMALVVAGSFLENEEVQQTATWAWQEMQKEIAKQFFADGFNFEYSTYYHRLATEMSLLGLRFAKQQGRAVNPTTSERLSAALSNLKLLMRQDGQLPIFGDNDSGRILDLDPDARYEGEELKLRSGDCSFISALELPDSPYHQYYQALDLPDMGWDGLLKNLSPERHNSNDLAVEKVWEIPLPAIDETRLKSYYLPDAGLVVIRSEEFQLAVNLMANPDGHRYRGHLHNDKGSFDLQVQGESLVVDPGVLSYTASVAMRNEYRQTAAHNIPYTGIEQNRHLAGFLGLFHNTLDVRAELLELGPQHCKVKLRYRGVQHIRRIDIARDHLRITDYCNRPFQLNTQAITPAPAYGELI